MVGTHLKADMLITGIGSNGGSVVTGSGWNSHGTQILLTTTTVPNDTATNTSGGGSPSAARSFQGHNTGKLVFELVYSGSSISNAYTIGLADATTPSGAGLDAFPGGFVNSVGNINSNAAGFATGSGWAAPNHFGSAWGPLVNGDKMQVAVDFTGDGISAFGYLAKNCSYLAGGDPTSGPSGTGNFYSFPVSTTVFAAVSMSEPNDGSFIIVTSSVSCIPSGYSTWN